MMLCNVKRILFPLLTLFALSLIFPAPWKTFDHLPEPIRPFRPILIAVLNEIFKSSKFPSFQPATNLLWWARMKTGLEEVYDDEAQTFRHGLDVLVDSIEHESSLTAIGRILVRAQLDITIENRLKIGNTTHHDNNDSHLHARPVFILGMPRSGTSFLHNLLSLDDLNFRAPRLWEIVDPTPALGDDGQDTLQGRIRIWMNSVGTAVFRFLTPNLAGVHPVSSTMAEECMPILGLSMLSYHFHTVAPVPTYQTWLMRQNQTKALLWHRRFLQVLNSRKIWLLKAPWHMNHLEAIFQVYPDARIVVTHRDPIGMLASLSSLITRLYGLVTDELDLSKIGTSTKDTWTEIVARFVAARRKLKGSRFDSQILDLSFGSLSSDPLLAVKQVYSFTNTRLEKEQEQKMKTWLENDVRLGKRGAAEKHVYKSEWFGLNETEIRMSVPFVQYVKDFL